MLIDFCLENCFVSDLSQIFWDRIIYRIKYTLKYHFLFVFFISYFDLDCKAAVNKNDCAQPA